MEFGQNLIRLPTVSAEAGNFSTVFPRLAVGMVLSALVLESHGDQAVIRFRGLDVSVRAQVPLEAGEQLTFLVSELSSERVVFRLITANSPQGLYSLTDEDLAQFLVAASLPVDKEGLAAVRALLAHGKALTAENVSSLVSAAKAMGDFSPPVLSALVFLIERDLPISSGTLAMTLGLEAGARRPAQALETIENLTSGASATRASEEQQSAPASPSGSRDAAQSAATAGNRPELPSAVMRSLQRLLDLFPKVDVAPLGAAQIQEPVGGTELGKAVAEAKQSSVPGPPTAFVQGETPSKGAEKAGGPVLASERPEATQDRPAGGAVTTAHDVPASQERTQARAVARQIAALVERAGTSVEARLAAGRKVDSQNDLRMAIAETERELDDALQNAGAQGRGAILEAQRAVRELANGLHVSQFLNAAPAPREESGAYFVFQLPFRTADGWETGELKLYRRDPTSAIDPNNASVLLNLEMRYLGPVSASIVIRNRAVSCEFRCEHSDALTALQSESPFLAEAFKSLGYAVRSIEHRQIGSVPATPESRAPAGRIDTRA